MGKGGPRQNRHIMAPFRLSIKLCNVTVSALLSTDSMQLSRITAPGRSRAARWCRMSRMLEPNADVKSALHWRPKPTRAEPTCGRLPICRSPCNLCALACEAHPPTLIAKGMNTRSEQALARQRAPGSIQGPCWAGHSDGQAVASFALLPARLAALVFPSI